MGVALAATARLLLLATACSAAGLQCQLMADRTTVVLYPPDLAPSAQFGRAVEVDAATGERLQPFAASTSDGLEAVAQRAMAYCAALPRSVTDGEAGRCGAELGKQMWACLTGVDQEAFGRDVGDDLVSSRWLVNQQVAGGFRGLCGLAARDDDVFASFRTHPAMAHIIEHVNPEQGEQYLSLLRQHAPDLLAPKMLKRLRRFDQRGGGQPIAFGGGVELSPNTLRYAWVHSRLRHHFGGGEERGWAAGWKVCEIGGGYGGQAALTLSLEPQIREYVLYDQPEPAALAARFLKEHPARRPSAKAGRQAPAPASVRTVGALEGEMGSVPPAAEDGGPCDLVISNYAVSELSVSLQWEYAERLILDAKRGYFTVNFQHKSKQDSGNFGRVINALDDRGYEVDQYAEVPQTDDKGLNTVVVATFSNTSEPGEPGVAQDGDGTVREPQPLPSTPPDLSLEELRGVARLRRAKSAAGGEHAWAELTQPEQRAALEAAAVLADSSHSARSEPPPTSSAGEEQELARLTGVARSILQARGGTAREALWAALAG
jgi:hypothetical protein